MREQLQEKISFPDSKKEIREIIDDSKMDQKKIDYYEDKIKNNDCLIVKDLFYSVITRSAKNKGGYQRTEYMDKDLTRLCDDTQYKNIREVAKALTLSESYIIKEYKLKDDVKKIDKSIGAIHIYEDKKIKNKNKFFIGKPINKFIEKISELAAIDRIKQKFKEIKNEQDKNLKNDLNEKKSLKLKR